MTCKICSQPLGQPSEHRFVFGQRNIPLRLYACYSCGVAEVPDDHDVFDTAKAASIRKKLIGGLEGFIAIHVPKSGEMALAREFVVITRKRKKLGEQLPYVKRHTVGPLKLLPQPSPPRSRHDSSAATALVLRAVGKSLQQRPRQ